MNTKKSTWASRFFTLGHVAKGSVYLMTGGLAVATVIGSAGGPAGPQGILGFVREQPFGKILLGLLALGLASYCLWRLYMALSDPDEKGTDTSGLVKRIGWACSGVFYGLLSAQSFGVVFGSSGGGGSGGKESAAAMLMSQPFGKVLMFVLAAIFLGTAIYQLHRGLSEKFLDKINDSQIGHDKYAWYTKFGKAGHVARAIIFAIIAYFVLLAGLNADPTKVRGMEGALSYLENNPYGFWLLGITGLGMMLYGAFMFVKAHYHQMSSS